MSVYSNQFVLLPLFIRLLSLSGAEALQTVHNEEVALQWCEKALASPRCSYRRINYFQKAIAQDPGCLEAYLELGETYYDLAISYGNHDLYRQAVGVLDSALRLNPDLWEAHYRLGTIYFLLRDFELCRKELEAARRLNPGYAPALNSLRLFNGAIADEATTVVP